MCIPLAWLQSCLSIAVIGAGAGALPMFLYKNVDNISNLHAIEPSRTVNHIAKEYFGLIKEDPKDCFQLFEMTGEDFVEKSERKYDYIMVDVECGGDEGDGLAAPPQSMLQLDFLRNLKEMLTDDGVLGINVIANSEKAHKLVVKSVTQVFDHGAVLQLPRNEIFYLMKSPQEALGNKEMLIKILEHSHLKQLHKFTQEILQDPHVNLEMLK
jgi:spermidine synthase